MVFLLYAQCRYGARSRVASAHPVELARPHRAEGQPGSACLRPSARAPVWAAAWLVAPAWLRAGVSAALPADSREPQGLWRVELRPLRATAPLESAAGLSSRIRFPRGHSRTERQG